MGKLINTYKRLGSELFWKKMIGCDIAFTCAIRKRIAATLYEKGIQEPFELIPQSKDYWYADPLFFCWNNKTYLFMEAFSFSKQKGDIVCSEIIDGKCSEIRTVLEEPFHLSFPNIFCLGHDIYMIPETEAADGISIYKCKKFPDEWERVLFFKTEESVVDSIVDHITNQTVYFLASSSLRDNPKQTQYVRFSVDFSKSMPEIHEIPKSISSQYSFDNRNAGRFIHNLNNDCIHCIQTSTPAVYGYSMKFYKTGLDAGWKKDTDFITEILPTHPRVWGWKKNITFIGVHTYDSTPEYEVIDLEYLRWDPLKWIRRLVRK